MAKTSKKAKANINVDELKGFYYDMQLIRRFEEKAGQLYGMGLIGGFCHLYIGQEAVVVGIESQLRKEDSVVTSYRDHGHMLAKGMCPNEIMAELTGREGGCSRGKGGSMHMFSKEENFYGGHGIVGAQIPVGAGLAFANQYNDEDTVSVAYMGDGACNQGQVYESFNMAALWKLPVVFVIENNSYGMGTSIERSCANSGELYRRGEAYGIPSMVVDGMDVLAVQEAAGVAVQHCRDGKGPYLMEIQTYRYRGHSMSDPAKYRSKEEVDNMKQNHDPIVNVKSMLLDGGHATEEEIKEMDKQIKAIVNESAKFSQESPEPHVDELWTDILVD